MKNLMSWLFYIPGGLLIGSTMLYSVFLSFQIVFSVFQAWAAYLSFIFFAMVYGIAPFYAGFALGDWTLLVVSYVGWLPGAFLIYIGNKISEDK